MIKNPHLFIINLTESVISKVIGEELDETGETYRAVAYKGLFRADCA